MSRSALVAGLALSCVLGAVVAPARASGPDPTIYLDDAFSGDGVWSADLGNTVSGQGGANNARSVESLPDGSLVVGAVADDEADHHHVALVKLSADGEPDTSVGDDGVVTWAVPGAVNTVVNPMVVDHEGRVVIAGWTGSTATERRLLVARFTSSLALDPSFGDGGYTVVGGLADSQAWDLQEQPDGKLVVAGQGGSPSRVQVLRLTEDGDLDPTFAGDGSAAITASGPTNTHIGVAVTGDAKIVVSGNGSPSASSTSGLLVRLTPAGALDPTFSGDGRLPVGGRELTDVVRLPDGDLAAVGPTSVGANGAVRLVRVSASGTLASWPGTTSAQRTIVKQFDDRPVDLALQGDGKLVAAGSASRHYPGDFDPESPLVSPSWLVLRTTATGALDPAFAKGGIFLSNWGLGEKYESSTAYGVSVSDAGKVLVAGGIGEPGIDGTDVVRFTAPSAKVAATTELRQTLSTGAWKTCGTSVATACTTAIGANARFGGRVWPRPSTRGATLEVQRANGTAAGTVDVGVTREGDLTGTFVPSSAGHYRVRLVVPATVTTKATTGPWRYVNAS